MSNLPAWKNIISGGVPPEGSPLYYYSPAPSFNGGGGSGSVAYADTAGTASYVDIRGNGITVNYGAGFISLTGSGGPSSISASYALTASYAFTASYVSSSNFNTSGSTIIISGSTEIIGPTSITGSLVVTEGITGSLEGTASWAVNAINSQTASFVNILGNKIIVNNYPDGIQLTGSDSVATASYVQLNYGPGIIPDPIIPMTFSASLRSVNGIYPTNGNVATALAGVITGDSASLSISSSNSATASLTEGAVWVISNDPTSSNNGRSFIYDVEAGSGSWYELSSLDLVTTDARYLKLDGANSPLQGNVNLGGFELTNGNLIGTASWALTSSNAISASYALTSSWAVSASWVDITGSGIIVNYSGSRIQLTGSAGGIIISSSIPGLREQGTLWFNSNDGNTYLQYIGPSGNTWIPAATSVGNAFSSSYAVTATSASVAQIALTSSFAITASYALSGPIVSSTTYFISVYSNSSYDLPTGYTVDICRYNVIDTLVNIPSAWFNISTYRFTPQKAGYWRITAGYDVFRGTTAETGLSITKNGIGVSYTGAIGTVSGLTSKTVYLNGTTDYVGAVNTGNGAVATRPQTAEKSYFQAQFISE